MKRFVIRYEWWEAEFDIDVAKAASACRESLEFFGDPIERADDSDMELVIAFLKFWAPTIINASSVRFGGTIHEKLSREEGLPMLDGSCGIQIVSVLDWRFEADDFFVFIYPSE